MSDIAICIMDMQEGYLSDPARKRDRDEMAAQVRNINLVLNMAAGNFPIIVVESIGWEPTIDGFDLDENRQWRPVKVNVPKGANVPNGLNSPENRFGNRAAIVYKGWNDAFTSTGIEEYLQKFGVGKLAIMGINASFCVKRTTELALERGYEVVTSLDLLTDDLCCRGRNKSEEFYRCETTLLPSTGALIRYLQP